MRIVVIGGTGLIGSSVVSRLKLERGAVAASRSTGVDSVSGEGLAAVLDGADVLVDATRSPSLDESRATQFFATSTSTLLAADVAAGVGHHVAISVVGTDCLAEHEGYFRAKRLQERLIQNSSVPHSIVRATQCFEFIAALANEATDGTWIRVPPVLVQPVAADDVAAAVSCIAVGAPINGVVELGGPARYRLADIVRRRLRVDGDPRSVETDANARYLGVPIGERDLLPGDDARIGEIGFADWLRTAGDG
jgi:uncharacterized protein YbjT (DUF2867 family)